MSPRPDTPTNEHASQPAPDPPAPYHRPCLKVLGTLAQLTQGENPGNESDLTFAGSGVL